MVLVHSLKSQSPMAFFESREEVRADFLNQSGWEDASASLVAEDWAARRFWRLKRGSQSAILMESVPDTHPASTAGHKIADMIKIGRYLSGIGLHVPEIYGLDEGEGFALLEDLGDISLSKASKDKSAEQQLYTCAANVLKEIQLSYRSNILSLPTYQGSAVGKGKLRIIDWFLPLSKNVKNSGEEREIFLNAFKEIESSLPACPGSFIHLDYHADNLMWLEKERGLRQIGILDYQGAHFGPIPYDLTNLLEDIRRDVDAETKEHVRKDFCVSMTSEERETFALWYKVLSSQFHCRIAGQVIKLFVNKGTTRYLDYLPRTLSMLKEEINNSHLYPLKKCFMEIGLNLEKIPEITPERVSHLVQSDAF